MIPRDLALTISYLSPNCLRRVHLESLCHASDGRECVLDKLTPCHSLVNVGNVEIGVEHEDGESDGVNNV